MLLLAAFSKFLSADLRLTHASIAGYELCLAVSTMVFCGSTKYLRVIHLWTWAAFLGVTLSTLYAGETCGLMGAWVSNPYFFLALDVLFSAGFLVAITARVSCRRKIFHLVGSSAIIFFASYLVSSSSLHRHQDLVIAVENSSITPDGNLVTLSVENKSLSDINIIGWIRDCDCVKVSPLPIKIEPSNTKELVALLDMDRRVNTLVFIAAGARYAKYRVLMPEL